MNAFECPNEDCNAYYVVTDQQFLANKATPPLCAICKVTTIPVGVEDDHELLSVEPHLWDSFIR